MTDYKCYLPWRGEFGWMIMCFVKKFHADPSPNKIICCKPGHECLFPTASKFFYDWEDIPDFQKAGAVRVRDEGHLSQNISIWLPDAKIEFVSLSEVGWHNKHAFAQHNFIPQPKKSLGLKVDVVITPRKRTIDVLRNWDCEYWQTIVDSLNSRGFTVGVCGAKETSCELDNILHKSYDYTDIDSDVELMRNAKLVITQESGMQYLSFLCQRPTISIGHYHGDLGADLHRDPSIFFKNVIAEPALIIAEATNYLESQT